jgi:predicted neuraminidase
VSLLLVEVERVVPNRLAWGRSLEQNTREGALPQSVDITPPKIMVGGMVTTNAPRDRPTGTGQAFTARLAAALAFLVLVPVATSAEKQTGSSPYIKTERIFPAQEQHAHGSTLVELPNGDLLIGWFQGSGERWADDVKILGARKKKGQSNWSAPFVLADVKEFPDCNPVLFLDGRNRLWIMWITIIANQWETSLIKYKISEDYSTMSGAPNWGWQDTLLLKPGGKTERGIQPKDPFVASVDQQVDAYTAYIKSQPNLSPYLDRWTQHATRMRSMARGENMMRAGRIYALDGKTDDTQMGYPYFRRMGWQTRNKPFFTASGRMIVPLYSDGFSISLMAYTDDNGENWKTSTPLVGGGNIQPAIAATRSGELVTYMRDNGAPPKRLHVSRSRDNGETWSMVQDSDLPTSGTACDIITLKNGNWILINNDTESGRHRLTVSLSEDEGRSWRYHKAIADDPSTRSHYPAIIVGADGMFHVSFSLFQADDKKTIVHAAFNEAWIRN